MTYILGDGASDSLFSDVKILGPMDTANQFNNIATSGGLGNLTANSGSAIDELDDNLRTGSADCPGSGDTVTVPYPADRGTSDWTFDFWFYMRSSTGNRVLFSNYDGANANSMIIDQRGTSTGLRLFLRDDSNTLIQSTGTDDIPTDTWAWVAICRAGNTCRLFLDGSIVTSVDVTGSGFDWTTKADDFLIGARPDGADIEPNFRVSEFRYTEAARYDEAGGVPTSALFSSSATRRRAGFF